MPTNEQAEINGSAPRVLIVAADALVRSALAGALADDSYEISFAANGQEAICLVNERPPDVVLLDQMMPGMNGFQVCTAIRSQEAFAEVPILLVTPLDSLEVKVSAFETGADDVLSRPMSPVEIRMRVRNITRLNRYRSLLQSRGDAERALESMRRAYDETIEGWAIALELRDGETKGHSERVSTWTLDLARAFGVSGDELERIRRGALLHDIGKMAVPDAVLRKEGPLDAAERRAIELHPVHGRDMLAGIEYLSHSIDIPYCHHERWDGMGYPQGLSGSDIPFHARLFSVVDVFDALTSDRPYRAAWKVERVIEYLHDQAGTQFDPDVTRVFCGLVEEGKLTDPPEDEDRPHSFKVHQPEKTGAK